MPKEKNATDLRSLQAHQEVGGASLTFQEMADNERSSYEEYTAKGRDVVGGIDGKIHSKMAKIYWFKKPIRK